MESHPPRKQRLLPLLAAAFALVLSMASTAAAGPWSPRLVWRSPLEPAGSGGLEALDRGLARLATHKRLLIIAAHPDDEDTTLLALVSRGMGGEAAYLSLSRGEGGQNLIGSELGVGLGLIRARELLAARERDGARQFFTRAYDFGYTRSLEETLERWPKETLLADVVWVIRRFRPQVVVAIFPSDSRAGHGQHQASAVVAEEAIAGAASAGPPGEPWRVGAFYRSAWFRPEEATLELPLGGIEPVSGRSILQLALESRSQHRSQDMGLEQPLGDRVGRLTWVSGAKGAPEEGPFGGIDTRLESLAELLPVGGESPHDALPAGARRGDVAPKLRRIAELAAMARRETSPTRPHAAVGPLLEILDLLGEVRRGLADSMARSARYVPGRRHLSAILAEKLWIARESLAAAAQVYADAVTEREALALGESFRVRTQLWNAGGLTLEGLEVALESPAGWAVGGSEPAEPLPGRFATRVTDERLHTVTVPAAGRPTVPYFLARPRVGDLHDWSEVDLSDQGQPFARAPLSALFSFELEGRRIELRREVVERRRDQALGEVRRPLRAVPPLEVRVSPEVIVHPLARAAAPKVRLRLTGNRSEPLRGRVELAVPAGWPAPAMPSFALAGRGAEQAFELEVPLPKRLAPGRYRLAVSAVTEAGKRHGGAIEVVDYPHIRPTPMPVPSAVELSVVDLRFPELGRLGYVRGASDRVPEALLELGLPLELLAPETLSSGDLSGFVAIVIGSRAYETEPALAAANARLLDYVRAGGLLIVQYQQYQFVRGGFAPFPLEIDRPHDRITDETARMALLVPEHPLFHTPNPLGPEDWRGWVQERGLYFAGTWDPAYTPLLAMADPGGEEQRGGLLVARLGRGLYVYTGLAFFRQLPAGVPGAYRLFANLLALGGDES